MLFMNAIAPKCNIYEHTRVQQLLPGVAVTEHGVIEAKQMIVATHFPFLNKHGSYFLKMYQHRSYVIAYENVKKMEGMYVDESQTGLYDIGSGAVYWTLLPAFQGIIRGHWLQ